MEEKAVAQIQKELDKLGLRYEDKDKPDFPIGKVWEAGIDLSSAQVEGQTVFLD